jgi:hypothetical protein
MLVNLCLALICVKAPALIEKAGLTKKGAVTLAFLNLCAWVPLILAFMFSDLGITPMWFALLWFLNIMPALLFSFQKDNWLSGIIPQKALGRYLGQRLAIKSAFYLGAFFFLGYLLDAFEGQSLIRFAFVFTLALVMALLDFVILTFMHEPGGKGVELPKPEPQKIRFGLFDYIGDLKNKKLDIFILFTSLFYLTVGLSGPLYAVYMLQEKNFTYLSFTIIIAAEYLARVISAPFWGKYADKAGNIKVLSVVSRIIPALPVLWLFCSNIGYLAFVQVVSGICWGAFDLSTQSYLYKVAPPEKKLRYIVYTRCIILLSTALGGLLGAYLVKGVFYTFGSQLLSVFLISGFFRAIVVMYLIPKLIDLAVSYGKPKNAPQVTLDMSGKVTTSKRGSFYRPPETEVVTMKSKVLKKETIAVSESAARQRNWAIGDRLVKSQVARKEIMALNKGGQNAPRRRGEIENRLSKLQTARKELVALTERIQNPRRPGITAQGKSVTAKKEAARPAVVTPMRRPWYGDAEIQAIHGVKKPAPSIPAVKTDTGKRELRQGLYYSGYSWVRYREETMQAILREKQEQNTATTLKPALTMGRVAVETKSREPLFKREAPRTAARVPVYVRA